MHAALGAQEAVRPAAVNAHGHALEAGLLALELVDDLGRELVPLRPAQVHAQEHLGPVGRLRAARAGRDGQNRVVLVVVPGEHEGGAQPPVFSAQGRELGVEPRGHVRLALFVGQLGKLEQIVGALDQRSPGRDLVAQAFSFAQDLARAALIGPEVRLRRLRLELVDARLLGG